MSVLRALVPALALATALAAEPATAPALAPVPSTPISGVMTATLSKTGRVRYGPSLEARIVTTLKAGQAVEVVGRSQAADWWIVRFPKEAKVWMHTKVLQPIDGGRRFRVNEDGARARDDSRVTAEIVAELDKGAIVEDRGLTVGDWRAVYPPDAVAYMHASVLSLPADLDKALAEAKGRGDAARDAWRQVQAAYADCKATLERDRAAALQLDWKGLAARLDGVIADHPDAEVKLAAQRLKEPVLAVIAAVDQVRQAKGQAPAPGPAVAATTGPAAVPTVPTPVATPSISAEQVQQISQAAQVLALYPAQGFVSQQDHATIGTSDVLIDDDGKVVAFLKAKPGAALNFSEYYWRWVGVKGEVQAVDPAQHGLAGRPVLVLVDEVKLIAH